LERIKQPKTQAELAIQHKQRFAFSTTMGDVVLKRIPYLDYEQILSECADDDKQFAIAIEKIAKYNMIAIDQQNLIKAWDKQGKQGEMPIEFPEEFKADRAWARMKVSKYNWRAYGPCFEKPVINCKEDLDIFLQNLQPDEREPLVDMLVALIAPMTDFDKNLMMLGIAHKYGLKWAPDLFLVNMTLQQAQVILETEMKEIDDSERMMETLAKLRG